MTNETEAPDDIYKRGFDDGCAHMKEDYQAGDRLHIAAQAARIAELEAKLAKAVKLMELSVELATWNTTLLDDVILFITELKGTN